jgi:hypothetical protein
MERSKPMQGPSQGEDAPALLGWGKPAGFGLAGKAGDTASSASVVKLPSGLVVRRYRRFVAYRVAGFDGVIELVAGLLFRVSRGSKGSVVYVNGRKIAALLGLGGTIHPIDLSVVYATMARLGFEVVEASRGKAVVVRTDHPLIEKIKAAKSVDEVVEIIKRYLGE